MALEANLAGGVGVEPGKVGEKDAVRTGNHRMLSW